jgi:hypothetical protein
MLYNEFVIGISFALAVCFPVIFPFRRTVRGWVNVANDLVINGASLPSQAQLMEYVKKIPHGQPHTYPIDTVLVELQFRFWIKPQIGYAYFMRDSTICIRWAGEYPVFNGTLSKCLAKVFLPVKTSRLNREILFLGPQDEIVSSISFLPTPDLD